jgi:predicted phosphoadenosine phosphosulfate sulfurtransferase
MAKQGLGIDVLTATRQRIAHVFDTFEAVYISFSGGKDSTVMVHLVMEEAIRRGRRVGMFFVDLEAQYRLTIEHIQSVYDQYAEHIEPYWCALPIALRNAVSVYEPKWLCWEPGRESDWVRQPPPIAITKENHFPFFERGSEFEEFVPAFGHWYSEQHMDGRDGVGRLTCCFVGIRSDESLNRYRTIAGKKSTYEGLQWTTWMGGSVYNAYPIYDWRTEDIWTYHAKTGHPYNRLYDRMHQAGLSIHQQRICQPYGDDQRKGLWLYHLIEPETWARVVARVNGANSGALYARDSGNINGTIRVQRPPHLTWEQFAGYILESLPGPTAEHYRDKIAVFIRWWLTHGGMSTIPDEADSKQENERKTPSWRRICKALLRNDYWMKGLSFTQTNSEAYEKYRQLMKRRRMHWSLPEMLTINEE